MKPDPEHRENFEVEFYRTSAGWLDFRIKSGDKIFESCFSDVYDPLPDLKHWLEAISIGVQQASFIYDIEGEEIKVDLEDIKWGVDRLTISSVTDEVIYVQSIVFRNQVVKAFYESIKSFAASGKYKKEEWEWQPGKRYNKLSQKLNLEGSKLPEYLGQQNRSKLAELLSENKLEIPKDYDSWSAKERWQFMVDIVSDDEKESGTRLEDIRSSIIDQYLKMYLDTNTYEK